MKFLPRSIPHDTVTALQEQGLAAFWAQLYAARGIGSAAELDYALSRLLPPASLKGADTAAQWLAEALEQGQRVCVVADYDCDGATACTLALKGLEMLGAEAGQIDYLVPNRIQDGYGLTPSIAQRVHDSGAQVLLTVDNGIASVDGVRHARALGLTVLITDHHLPADELPDAHAIVNPNQPGCLFASKNLAGVGVMFYVLLALRSLLRERGIFTAQTQPRLDALLPLVALGTVADVVPLDANNRLLVAQGLERIRAGRLPVGMLALFEASQRTWAKASTQDLAFGLAPRLNAAGRLTDMTIGIECLRTDDASRAQELAATLDDINRKRRELESDMRIQAQAIAERLCADTGSRHLQPPAAISVFDEGFHEGVVGIVASRLKDQFHRPAFVFAPSAAAPDSGTLKGSGRSIAGFHLRDALDLLAKRHPQVLEKFGGHAMAAGCSIRQEHFALFQQAMAEIAREWLHASDLQGVLLTDGALPAQARTLEHAQAIGRCVWGQGFAAPLFSEELEVLDQRILAGKHSALKLLHHGQMVDAIWFGHNSPLPRTAHLAYRLEVNEWQQRKQLRFVIEGCEAPAAC